MFGQDLRFYGRKGRHVLVQLLLVVVHHGRWPVFGFDGQSARDPHAVARRPNASSAAVDVQHVLWRGRRSEVVVVVGVVVRRAHRVNHFCGMG